jgi:hypothetical protein
MSRVYFHTLDETDAELHGSERAYMGNTITNLCSAMFVPEWNKDKIIPLLGDNYFTNSSERDFAKDFRIWLSVGSGDFKVGKTPVEKFGVELNTAYKIGGDAVKLMCRIHGQCEMHCWIPGKDRIFIADIIDAGLKDFIFRDDQGWDDVTKLLRSGNKNPIVMSYSVCDQFPNMDIAEYYNADRWYALRHETQWHKAFAKIKNNAGLKICRETWSSFYFNYGDTAMSLLNRQVDMRRDWTP